MKKKCLASEECPLARGYNAIGDWWSLLIVSQILLGGRRRFSEIQDDLGMARNILTARLKKLVEQGILEKVQAAEGSAYQAYSATATGRDLFKVLVAMRQWGETHFGKSCGEKYLLVDRTTHQPIAPLEVRAANGTVLGPEDLVVVKNDNAPTD